MTPIQYVILGFLIGVFACVLILIIQENFGTAEDKKERREQEFKAFLDVWAPGVRNASPHYPAGGIFGVLTEHIQPEFSERVKQIAEQHYLELQARDSSNQKKNKKKGA